MKLRELKYEFKNKQTLYICFGFLLFFGVIYFNIKNELFYLASEYIHNYMDYYVNVYLEGNVNNLIFNDSILFFVENDIQYVISALYIYVASFGTVLFKILMFIFPIFVFHKINVKFHNEIYNKFSIPKITRIGFKKYVNSTIAINALYIGIIFVFIKIIYFILLHLFFPVGISSNHFIYPSSFINQSFLYIGYDLHPYLLVVLSLFMTFLYSVILSNISLNVIVFVKNKGLSYLTFIGVMLITSIIPAIFNQSTLLSYISIFNYFDTWSHNELITRVWFPILLIFVFAIISLIFTREILIKRIKKLL